jgi:hypothetical protein
MAASGPVSATIASTRNGVALTVVDEAFGELVVGELVVGELLLEEQLASTQAATEAVAMATNRERDLIVALLLESARADQSVRLVTRE